MAGREAGLPIPRDGRLLGHLFESLVALSVSVYAPAAEARVRQLRLQGGRREVDPIGERADQRVVAIEVKLGGTAIPLRLGRLRYIFGILQRRRR